MLFKWSSQINVPHFKHPRVCQQFKFFLVNLIYTVAWFIKCTKKYGKNTVFLFPLNYSILYNLKMACEQITESCSQREKMKRKPNNMILLVMFAPERSRFFEAVRSCLCKNQRSNNHTLIIENKVNDDDGNMHGWMDLILVLFERILFK